MLPPLAVKHPNDPEHTAEDEEAAITGNSITLTELIAGVTLTQPFILVPLTL